MRLKTRLTLAFLLVAWVPLGVVVGMLTHRAGDAFQATFEARVGSVKDAVDGRLGAVDDNVRTAVDRIANHRRVANLVQELAREVFYDTDAEREFIARAPELMADPGLDTLRFLDLRSSPAGSVIAMGHRRSWAGEDKRDVEGATLAEAHADTAFFRHERIEDGTTGAAIEVWTRQVVHPVEGAIALIGGKVVDQRLLEDLHVGEEGTYVALLDAGGAQIASTYPGPPAELEFGYEIARSTFHNPGGDGMVATLNVYVSRASVKSATSQIWGLAAILGSASGLLALFAGIWISRRISRPLEELSDAATAVANGARDRQVIELSGKDEVATLTRAFNRMTLDLGESEERLRQSERVAAWREIARRIAHEIKNPLFPIQMSIETLKKVYERQHPDFEEIFEESTATILEEVERMKRIVGDFSDFARMPAPRPRAVDIGELGQGVVTLLRDTAPDVDLRFVCEGAAQAIVDPDQIRQALLNIVKNGLEALAGRAPDATDEPPALELRVEPDGDAGIRIVVTDNGPGMDEATRGKLFVPYFTTKAQGTGLGLAIVHRIVAEHGGMIQIDSTEGVGTRFVVRLPRGQHMIAAR